MSKSRKYLEIEPASLDEIRIVLYDLGYRNISSLSISEVIERDS